MTDQDTLNDSKENPRQQKREVILNEATRQFNSRGYFDTRLEDIAERTDTAKTNISYHFKSKEALLQEVYSIACDFSDAEFRLAANAENGLQRVLHIIRAFAYAHANSLSTHQAPLALFSDLSVLAGGDGQQVTARYQLHVNYLRQFLQEGIEDQSIQVQSVDASTFFLFSILHWLPRWLASIPSQGYDDAIEALCDVICYGVCAERKRKSARPILRSGADEFPDVFDRETRNQLKREAFLRTGTRFLNKKGFRSLSLSEIATELGVTRGAFYYYIEDKDALIQHCFERTCDLIERSRELASKEAGDAVASLERSLRWLFEGHITDLDPLLRMSLLHALAPAQQAAARARLKLLSAGFAQTIASGMVDGSIRAIDLDAAEQVALGTIFAASRQRLMQMPLHQNWRPAEEPVAASAAYFEPFFKGLSKKGPGA